MTEISKMLLDRLKAAFALSRDYPRTATIITALLLGVILWAVSGLFVSRFTFINAGGGKLYKVDRRTGQSWFVDGDSEKPVSTPKPAKKLSPEELAETAIHQAENSSVLYRALNPDKYDDFDCRFVIEKELQSYNKNVPEVHGWRAKIIDDDTYLVSYTYTEASGTERGFYFEVKTNGSIVKNIFLNSPIYYRYKQYGINPAYRVGSDGVARWEP